jgi:hypothetical protein
VLAKGHHASFEGTTLVADMFKHRGICLALCKQFDTHFAIPEKFCDDEDFMRRCPPSVHHMASTRLMNQKSYAEFVFQEKRNQIRNSQTPAVYPRLGSKLRDSKDLLKQAVWSEGIFVFQSASSRLRDDPNIVFSLMLVSIDALCMATARLRKDQSFLTTCLATIPDNSHNFDVLRRAMFTQEDFVKHTAIRAKALQAWDFNIHNKHLTTKPANETTQVKQKKSKAQTSK